MGSLFWFAWWQKFVVASRFSPLDRKVKSFQMSIDIVTNPAWKDLECNVYHEEDDASTA